MIILQGNKLERSFSGDVLFDNINLQVDEHDRIALVGPNGAGKSTLLKILVGEETAIHFRGSQRLQQIEEGTSGYNCEKLE